MAATMLFDPLYVEHFCAFAGCLFISAFGACSRVPQRVATLTTQDHSLFMRVLSQKVTFVLLEFRCNGIIGFDDKIGPSRVSTTILINCELYFGERS